MMKERQKKREEGREREGEREGEGSRERVCMQDNSQNMNNIITCRGHTSRENFSRS